MIRSTYSVVYGVTRQYSEEVQLVRQKSACKAQNSDSKIPTMQEEEFMMYSAEDAR